MSSSDRPSPRLTAASAAASPGRETEAGVPTPGIPATAVPPSGAPGSPAELSELLTRAARGDEIAFARLVDALSPTVFGLARRILRDPTRAEEVAQEVFLQVWQTAARFDPARGHAKSWIMTLTHRRAVDAVRHDQSASDRDHRWGSAGEREFDEVDETVTTRLEHEQVRRCLDGLTGLQREAIALAYYQGYTYAEVATVLEANPATVKTRIRDGLVRLRDCLGVEG